MSTPVQIIDGGLGTKRTAAVDRNNHLAMAMYPPTLHLDGEPSKFRFFSEYLGTTGGLATFSSAGNADMGATTNVYFIAAAEDYDIRIMSVGILVADSAVTHGNFGAINPLTTGFDLSVIEAGVETFLISDAKTGGELISQTNFMHGYGDGAQSWELLNWSANEDAQTVTIPVGQMVPGGIRLGRGTKDRIVASVQQDLDGLTEMFVRVMGYRHYP